MPELFILSTLLGPGLFAFGVGAAVNGEYAAGAILIAVGLLVSWLRFAPKKPRTYHYTLDNCPHKGERPVYGMFKEGFHWYKYSIGEDDNTMVTCNDCGYTVYHADINPLAQVSSDLLGIKAHPELLPVHP